MKKYISLVVVGLLLGAPLAFASDSANIVCQATGFVAVNFEMLTDGTLNYGNFEANGPQINASEVQTFKNNSSAPLSLSAKSSTATNGTSIITPMTDAWGATGFAQRLTMNSNLAILDTGYRAMGTMAVGDEDNVSFSFTPPATLPSVGTYQWTINVLAIVL